MKFLILIGLYMCLLTSASEGAGNCEMSEGRCIYRDYTINQNEVLPYCAGSCGKSQIISKKYVFYSNLFFF